MQNETPVRVSANELHDLYRRVALSLGASREEAEIYSACFARADLRHDTQGLPLWLEWALPLVEASGAHFGTPLKVLRETASSILVDGANGIGQIVATRTMERVINLACETGVAIGLVSNSTDMAMLGNYAMQASARGCIGIAACTAGPASVAPWGGAEAVFGTNPLAIAFPAQGQAPIVIDMCCARFSIGTLVEAARAGYISQTPVVADRQGRYSGDPAAIVSDLSVREPALQGAILPEGVRSAALLLLVEILAGLLTGTGTSLDQRDWSTARPPRVGAFLCAIDVEQFITLDQFGAQIAAFADAIRAVRPAQGFDTVRLPGDRATVLETERRDSGIAISPKHWGMIQHLCVRYGVAMPEARL